MLNIPSFVLSGAASPSTPSDLYLTSENYNISAHSSLAPGSHVVHLFVQQIPQRHQATGQKLCRIKKVAKYANSAVQQGDVISDSPFEVAQTDPPAIYVAKQLNDSIEGEFSH